MDLFEESALDTTVAIAQSLATRAGLPAELAAVIALVDAVERGRWRGGSLDAAFAELTGIDRTALVAAVETLVAAQVIVERQGSHALAPDVRRLLSHDREASTDHPAPELAGLAELLAPHGAVVVAIVEDPAGSVASIRDGLGRPVALLSDRADLDVLRDTWLRGEVAAFAPSARLWISAVAKVPARVVACLDAVAAGETIALLRRHHRVAIWRPAVTRAARIAPPKHLEPLVYTDWNGIRTPTPAVRLATLRGTVAEIERAAAAVAAAHGLPLTRADGRNFAALRDALTAADKVVLLEHLAGLEPLPSAALGTLLAQTTSIVMISGDDLPGPVAAISHVIDLPVDG